MSLSASSHDDAQPVHNLLETASVAFAFQAGTVCGDVHLHLPPKARPVAPRQLPMAPCLFTGREGELRSLDDILERQPHRSDRARVATIVGPGGSGKTTLALHWSHQHSKLFPDGELFVDLGGSRKSGSPTGPAAVVYGFLMALGMEPGHIPVDLQERTTLFRAQVVGRRLLFLLDDAEDKEQVLPLLSGDPSCAVLITSRNPLVEILTNHGCQHVRLTRTNNAEARCLHESPLEPDRLDVEPAAPEKLLQQSAGRPLPLSEAADRCSAGILSTEPAWRTPEASRPASSEMATPKRKLLRRRDFMVSIMAIALGMGAGDESAGAFDTAEMMWGIDATDVEVINDVTRQLGALGARLGGGNLSALRGYLRTLLSYPLADCAPEVRPELVMAMARAASTTAWALYDVEQNKEARKHWLLSLRMARSSGHRLSDDFFVRQLIALNHQAIHLGRNKIAGDVMELADALSRNDKVTNLMRSYVLTNHSWARAVIGDRTGAVEKLERGLDLFHRVDHTERYRWSETITHAEMQGQRGQVYFRLARQGEGFEASSLDALKSVVAGYGTSQPRSRAMNLPCLSEAYMRVGDFDRAITVGLQACDAAAVVGSRRTHRRIWDLRRALEAHSLPANVHDFARELDARIEKMSLFEN